MSLYVLAAILAVATALACPASAPFAPLPTLYFFATHLPRQNPQPTETGTIEGIVPDDQGKPLPDAVVYGLPEQDMRNQLHTTTDKDGRFTLPDVPAGGVYLGAFKESDWYPYNFFSFFITPGQKTPNDVQALAGETTKGAVIQLGQRAGRLNIEIEDDRGLPISSGAELVFTRPDMPGQYSRGVNNKASLLVPPVPFRLLVQANQYQPWHYTGTKDGLLRLKPRETSDLTVILKRAP